MLAKMASIVFFTPMTLGQARLPQTHPFCRLGLKSTFFTEVFLGHSKHRIYSLLWVSRSLPKAESLGI